MLCKCSGKYIDIYFILKITYFCVFAAFFDYDPCMFSGFSGVLTAACFGLCLAYALDLTAFLDLITLWTLSGLRLDHDGHRLLLWT